MKKINDAHFTQQQHLKQSAYKKNTVENTIKTTETNIADNMEIDLMIFNENKRIALSSLTVSRNTEEDTEIDNEQNAIATKIRKDLTIKKKPN